MIIADVIGIHFLLRTVRHRCASRENNIDHLTMCGTHQGRELIAQTPFRCPVETFAQVSSRRIYVRDSHLREIKRRRPRQIVGGCNKALQASQKEFPVVHCTF